MTQKVRPVDTTLDAALDAGRHAMPDYNPDDYAPDSANVHVCSECGAAWAGFYDENGRWRIIEYYPCSCKE